METIETEHSGENRLEAALELLEVKIGSETSREEVLAISHEKRPVISFVITENLDIWLSNREHAEIIVENNLKSEQWNDHVEGYAGCVDGNVVVLYYEQGGIKLSFPRGTFPVIFHKLFEQSGLSQDAFIKACKEAVKGKIQMFLEHR